MQNILYSVKFFLSNEFFIFTLISIMKLISSKNKNIFKDINE